MKTGDSFGQLALIENKPRSASIVCKEDCHFALFEKEPFDGILSFFFKKNFMNLWLI
jgi:CRP-like cAMP-binding protein